MSLRLVVSILGVVAVSFVCLVARESKPPKTVPEIILRTFEHRLAEPIEVVSRKSNFAPFWSIHGTWYWEDTVIRLSPKEYGQLVTQAAASNRFTTRVYSGHVVFDRDAIKWRVSWAGDEKEHTLSYSYSEQ